MVDRVVSLVVLVLAGLIAAGRSFKVVQQYEQGIIFRFGRVLPGTRSAGLTLIRPVGDRMQKVNMQIIAMAVPAQEGITRDNVTVRVDAVVYFRVVDPIKATINVQNYMFAISQQAQTSLRSIIGQSDMDQLLSERDTVHRELLRFFDKFTPSAPAGDTRSAEDSASLADFGDDDVAVAEAEITSGAPLEIPEVPRIPQLPVQVSNGKQTAPVAVLPDAPARHNGDDAHSDA